MLSAGASALRELIFLSSLRSCSLHAPASRSGFLRRLPDLNPERRSGFTSLPRTSFGVSGSGSSSVNPESRSGFLLRSALPTIRYLVVWARPLPRSTMERIPVVTNDARIFSTPRVVRPVSRASRGTPGKDTPSALAWRAKASSSILRSGLNPEDHISLSRARSDIAYSVGCPHLLIVIYFV